MKVVEIKDESILFTDGTKLYSYHNQDCCETHYLCLNDISLDDFYGLEFDLSNDNFFERVKDYGIRLLPINGHAINIPGYGENSGYYSENLSLIIKFPNGATKIYEISECQEINP